MRLNTRTRRRSFVPFVEGLERLQLLTAGNISGFFNALVTEPNVPKHGYALPGMDVVVHVDVAQAGGVYTGVKRFDLVFEGLSTSSVYTTSLGDPEQIFGAGYINVDPVSGQQSYGALSRDFRYFAPKDPGDYTISISVVAGKSTFVNGWMTIVDETLTDTLTLTVEAPQVTQFIVEGKAARFDTMSPNGHNGADGIGVLTWQPNDTPGFLFHATVSNQTHYDARVGFIQVVKPNRSGTYAGRPTSRFSSSSYMWDGTNPGGSAVWYNNTVDLGYWTIPAGQSKDLSNATYPFTYIDDSPY